MAEMLEWLDQEVNILRIYMLRILMDKIDCIQEQMNKDSRKKEILRKNQKEMLEIKNTVTEMKSVWRAY